MRRLLTALAALALSACKDAPLEFELEQDYNVLIILADDLGIDRTGTYGVNPEAPPTPTIDRLAEQGLLFRNAYAHTVCSPTRAGLLTGRHGRRHGVGTALKLYESRALPLSETTLAEVLQANGYSTSLTGKWHLTGVKTPADLHHPGEQGFDWFAGALGNLDEPSDRAEGEGYYDWEKNVNGELTQSTTYATTDTTDDAILRMQAMAEPWLLYVPYNAPHVPYHEPPQALHGLDLGDDPTHSELLDAAIIALDTELARLLDALPEAQRERTLIVFMGDNGTASSMVSTPFREGEGKVTLHEGGVRVPMIIAGPGVPEGAETEAWSHVVDLFPTLLGHLGGDVSLLGLELDGLDLGVVLADPSDPGPRDRIYAEFFKGDLYDSAMIRDAEWKLIASRIEETESLHRMTPGEYGEGPELTESEIALDPEASAALERLRGELYDKIHEMDPDAW